MRKIEMAGRVFGRLTVISEAGRDKRLTVLWKCICDCGNIKIIRGSDLRNRQTESCGCKRSEVTIKRNITHGKTGTLEHNIWRSMRTRCLCQNNPAYSSYGGRGITICERWMDFENFFEDMKECPKGLSIERIDNDKGYLPNNCKWGTRTEQNRNKRVNKESKTGVSGVTWSEQAQKYKANIGVDNELIHLGYFKIMEQAIAVRKEAEVRYWGK